MKISSYLQFNEKITMKRKTVRVRDISISYLLKDSSQAESTIIFIHGFPFNKNMWIGQLDALPSAVRGIALDVRGHGNTTSGHGFFNMDVFAKDLIAFIETLKLERIVLCGISMGGYIALRAFELRPALFSGIVLSDTHSFADTDAGKLKRFATIESVLKHGKRIYAIGFVSSIFSKKSIEEKPEVVDLIKSSIRRNTESSICATLLALASRTDTTSVLQNMNVPVLILRGEEDGIVSLEQVKSMEELIPDVKHIEIPDCGHLPNLENPVRFNGEIRNFLISKIL